MNVPVAKTPSRAPAAYAATVAVSEPAPAPAAAVRRSRNDERSKRDLFGAPVDVAARVVEHHGSPFTAARNETSVLFSLDQLAKPTAPGANYSVGSASSSVVSSNGAAKKDDSGIIDLNKMMAAESLTAGSVRASPSEAPLGYAREISLTPVPSSDFVAPPKKRKTALYVGLGVAAAVGFAALGLVVNNQEDARMKAAAAAAAPPPPVEPVATPAPAPLPAAQPDPVANASTTASVDKSDKPDAKTVGSVPMRSKGHKGSARTHSASASAAPAAPAPKKAADPCGCHGDLLCSMKCSSH